MIMAPSMPTSISRRRAAPHRGIDVHYGQSDPIEPGHRGEHTAAEDGGEHGDEFDTRPSKTQLKTRSHDLQALGVAVAALSQDRLSRIDLPEQLRDAIDTYRKIRSHEGRRRQMQYVGKLMRSADEAMLREAVAAATLGSARDTFLLHETERWRAALVADDSAMTTWLDEHPDCDTQQLRSLVRAARREAAALPVENRQPKSFRELFQFIKPHLANMPQE
jgi:ribosome-associated protein